MVKSIFVFIVVVLFISCKLIASEPDHKHLLKINNGQIKGKSVQFRGINVHQFLCIPYGEAPINELRFKKPLPKSAWTNVLTTDKWGPQCMQPIYPGLTPPNITYSEDCLCLNVFTTTIADGSQKNPAQQLKPVMVWIHGGAFMGGSANSPDQYDGTVLAALEDVIVVTINYRVGVFGFLHLPEAGVLGNMGLWDQRLALKWVHENAHYFGGDCERVTIFGESAGSISVSAHLVSPQSKGLFKNAIMQSGAIYDINRYTVKNLSKTFLTTIGCTPSSSVNEIQSCLSSFKFDEHREIFAFFFWPIIGDEFIPKLPEEIIASKGVDPSINVLLGTVGYEGALMMVMKDPVTFNPSSPVNLTLSQVKGILGYMLGQSSVDYYHEKYSLDKVAKDDADTLRLKVVKIIGDVILTCPTYIFGRDLVQKSGLAGVYSYYQSQKPSFSLLPGAEASKWLPVSHGDDILPVFGYPFANPVKYSHEDLILSSFMVKIWGTFAKTSKPLTLGPHTWLNWAENGDRTFSSFTMELNSQKIGPAEGMVKSCFDNWPFPLEKTYNLAMEMGRLSTLDGH